MAACETPGQINPRLLGRDISGAAAEARLPPPGLDRPLPNLASVPPVPERPDLASREALTRMLEAERAASAIAVPARRPDAALTEPDAPGQPPISARPPGPPALARAPVVPWASVVAPARPAAGSGAISGSAPASAPQIEAPMPGAVPALPPPELLAPGAAPALPPADLLAPGTVPSPPPADLLAPGRRR